MDFKEKRLLQKSITENLSKLETGDLSFKEKRDLQKSITTDLVKIGEAPPVVPEMIPTPVYDQLKTGAFIDLPAAEFIEKLKEAAGELGVSDSLTVDIIDPANAWKNKREGVATEGVTQDQAEIDYVDKFLNDDMPIVDESTHEDDPDTATESAGEELEDIALEDVQTKLNIGDKFKLKGKVYNIDNQESAKKKGNYNSITIEFPFNFDWGRKHSTRFTTHFTLKDDGSHSFKIDDETTLDVELREIKGKKPEKEGDPPIVYYGLNFESPEGFKKQDSEYVNFASEKSVLKHMIGSGVATESAESGDPKTEPDPALEGANLEAKKPETEAEVESEAGAEGEQKEAGTDPATESATESVEDEIEFDYDEDIDVNPEGDFSELSEEGLSNEAALNPEIATEKAKDVDEKLWKYAKKIVLRARFDKKPSGNNEKDNETITGGKAWGFVQDRYQKLVSGKIKARKKVATESAGTVTTEEKPAVVVGTGLDFVKDPPPDTATESVDEEEGEEIII